jgi:hypothetical protein
VNREIEGRTPESKIKLPRRRKKRYIKKHGAGNYIENVIINEILREEGKNCAERFYCYQTGNFWNPKILYRY